MIDQFILWRDLVRTISTGSLPFTLLVNLVNNKIILIVRLGVKDIHDGHDSQTGTSEPLPAFPGTSGFEWHPSVVMHKAEEIVYAVVQKVWLHELREHWTVGRNRVRDPHQGVSDGVGTNERSYDR